MSSVAKTNEQVSAEFTIRALAEEHGIIPVRTALDEWADDITRLSDDDVKLDNVEDIIVVLGRERIIDGVELTKLHARYLRETGVSQTF